MKNIKWTKETTKRVFKTFLQAALAYAAMNIAGIDFTGDRDMIKTALIGLALSATSAGIAALMNLQSPANPEQLGGASALTFEAWIKKYLGKKTDYDGVYGVQCVDLIDCYIDKCLGLKKGFWGNAKNWWTDRNKSTWLKNNFEFITPKYKNGELKAGDIGIRTSGTYGHIFIVSEPSANGKFKYYDQNATGKHEAMTLRTKAFTSENVNGILRPKNQTPFKAAVKKPAASSFKKGDVVTLTTNVNVRTGAGTSYKQKTVSQLTKDGKKNATSKLPLAKATLKKGTKVTIQSVETVGSDIWAQIPSGWICLRCNGKNYAK
ncbi:MAG: CHAP domain-containing protein [Eubacterium sp.]|nr:CHAP domain-containing protein [Eubacterium sp.]